MDMVKNDVLVRLEQLLSDTNENVVRQIIELLLSQNLVGKINRSDVENLRMQFDLSTVELALACLPIAACYATVPVSHFYVGAVAIGESGNFYFGANQEFAKDAIQQSVHAEQSAISHAWLEGEKSVTDVVVNYTPCGHCRQFMNELNTSSELRIHLPHSQNNLLHNYLPDAFGPKNLDIDLLMFDAQQQDFKFQGDELVQSAINAASLSYAPYSDAFSGIALQVGNKIVTGRYIENAAFNPSFLPLQCALNYARLRGYQNSQVTRIVLAEKYAVLSHKNITASLAQSLLGLEIEYVQLS